MRRTYVATLALVLAVALTGCGAETTGKPQEQTKSEQGKPQAPAPAGGGFAYIPTAYEVIPPGQEPATVAAEREQMRKTAGAKAIVVDHVTYAVITAGEVGSGGYSVEVVSIGDSEGKLEIVYRVNSPAPGTMTTQAIEYPSLVVKFQNKADLPVSFREAK